LKNYKKYSYYAAANCQGHEVQDQGQGQGLDVQGQGQGLHKVSLRRLEAKAMASRTSSLVNYLLSLMKHAALLASYLSGLQVFWRDRIQCTRNGQTLSSYNRLCSGIIQGIVIRPILFVVYIA